MEVKRQLLEDVRGKSTRQVEKHLAMIAPHPVPQERERVVTKDETEVRVVLNDRVMEKLRRIRDGWSHKNTNYSYAELIEAMADAVREKSAKKLKPKKTDQPKIKANCISARVTSAPQVKDAQSVRQSDDWFSSPDPYANEDRINPRYIPAAVKRAVWQRDQAKCQRAGCISTFLIQVDHKEPRVFGGSNDPENLRLLCAAHNRVRAPFQIKIMRATLGLP